MPSYNWTPLRRVVEESLKNSTKVGDRERETKFNHHQFQIFQQPLLGALAQYNRFELWYVRVTLSYSACWKIYKPLYHQSDLVNHINSYSLLFNFLLQKHCCVRQHIKTMSTQIVTLVWFKHLLLSLNNAKINYYVSNCTILATFFKNITARFFKT